MKAFINRFRTPKWVVILHHRITEQGQIERWENKLSFEEWQAIERAYRIHCHYDDIQELY